MYVDSRLLIIFNNFDYLIWKCGTEPSPRDAVKLIISTRIVDLLHHEDRNRDILVLRHESDHLHRQKVM